MKKILSICFALLIFAASFVGCKDEIEPWSAKSLVWFTDTTYVNYTFAVAAEGTTEAVVQLPVTYAGKLSTTDRTINVECCGAPRNSLTRYQIETSTVGADQTSGTVNIRVFKTSNLDNERDTIRFRLTSSEDFDTGFASNLEKTIIVYNRLVCPDWWGKRIAYYLGYYSEEKYQIIYTVCGSLNPFTVAGDEMFEYDDYYNEYVIIYAQQYRINYIIYKLNQYCEDNNLTYSDGTPITFDYNSR